MSFSEDLPHSLKRRTRVSEAEFAAGQSLEDILNADLRTVEELGHGDLLTSVLIVDDDGSRLLHGAAPSLPKDYCEAIHGIEIGQGVGSCGTAAYLGHAVYVTDIATDPLWVNFRDLALQHGLKACWSTPIKDRGGRTVATFAIYYRTPRSPKPEELDAILLIAQHVADAISRFRRFN